MENSVNRSILTVKNVIRFLAIICLIVFFCPTFLVSCSGKDWEIDAMTIVNGISYQGQTVTEPVPFLLICLAIPVCILVMTSIKKYLEKTRAMIIAIAGVVDLFIWFIFKTKVKEYADANYCDFETTGWYLLNNISLILIIIISVLVLARFIQMDSEILPFFTGNKAQEALKQMTNSMNKMSNAVNQLSDNMLSNSDNNTSVRKVIGYCPKCGNPLKSGALFCPSCGTPVPKSLIDESEPAGNDAEAPAATAPAQNDDGDATTEADNNN